MAGGDYGSGEADGDKENAAPHQNGNVLSNEEQVRFNKLVVKAKDLASQGQIRKAIDLNKTALKLCYTEKLARRIGKMETYLKECEEDEDDDEAESMVHVGEGFYLYKDLYAKLYAHQREGVLWMWRIFSQRKGGILGDDMGLGKTIQVIAFLSGMFDSEKFHSVLIILPVAVMINWEREFQKWAPGIPVTNFHGGSKKERERTLSKLQRRGGVLMTSYGMLVNNADQLAERDGREYVWDSIILDEGHKIKNPSNKCSKGLHRIAARMRLILTGTPIQNNLKEMWALFDWTHQGSLLGTGKTFSMEFDGPISRARQKDATPGEERLGQEMANSLKRIIEPYFMRRTKAQVTKAKQAQDKANQNQAEGDQGLVPKAKDMPTLKRKNDLIIWAYMSDVQQRIYQDFAHSEEVKELLNTSRSPLTALMVLKKICDHPRLLTNRQCNSLGLDMDAQFHGEGSEAAQDQSAASRIQHIPNEQLVKESGKMVFLIELLDNLKAEGHRCLVFSQSRKVLDILQKVLRARDHKVARVDGTMRLLAEREEMIAKFTRDKSYSVFLLTTQVGGVGLTITAADRVVIYDPSWNPATDAQAVDRAFRIGQERNVVIYRIITCGSIEEKIYRRQIFKDSINKQTTGESKNPYKYFTKQELFELFELDNVRESTTQQQLAEIHAGRRNTDTSLDAHIAYLLSTDIYGISDHDLMFTKEAEEVNDEDLEASNVPADYIEKRVQRANQLISMESEENVQMTEQLGGKYPGAEANKNNRPSERMPPHYQWQPGPSSLEDNVKNLHLQDHGVSSEEEACAEESEQDDSIDEDSDGHESVSVKSEKNASIIESSPAVKPTKKWSLTESPSKETPAGQRADKPILLSDTPVRGDPNPRNNGVRNLVNDSVDNFEQPASSNDETDEEADNTDEMEVVDESTDMVASETPEKESSNSSGSFHTPGDSDHGSPERAAIKKRESPTPDMKASAKKRRRSVAWTPGGGGRLGRPVSPNASDRDQSDMQDVVAEELVFSPSASKPLVQTERRASTSSSVDYPMDYQDFTEEVNARSNSTALFDSRPAGRARPKLRPLDTLEGSDEDDEETEPVDEDDNSAKQRLVSDNDSSVQRAGRSPLVRDSPLTTRGTPKGTPRGTPRFTPGSRNLNDSAADSPVHAVKSKRQAVIASSDEESFREDETNRTASLSSPESDNTEDQHRSIREDESMDDEADAPRSRPPTHDDSRADQTAESVQDETRGEGAESDNTEGGEEEEEEEVGEEQEEEEEEEEYEEEDEEEEEEEEMSEEDQQRYLQLMTESRKYYKQGDYATALTYCIDALDIFSGDERANVYALKLQHKLAVAENNE